jgi:hypothetical protein
MAVKFTKPEINVREKLAELDKPSGIAGEAMLRAETPQEQFNLIGAGRRNILINGDFQVSQRGAYVGTTTAASNAYFLDRWLVDRNGTATMEHTTGHDLPGTPAICKAIKLVQTVTGNNYLGIRQRIENPTQYVGRTLTYSAWVRSNTPNARIEWYTQGTAQLAIGPAHSGNGEWEYLSFTATMTGNPSTNWYVDAFIDNGSYSNTTITAGEFIEVTMAQLEIGTAATPFEHRSYGEELALCQRYYQKFYDESSTGQVMLMGLASGTGHFTWWPSVEMRARPTVGITTTTPYWESFPWYSVGTSLTVSSISNGHLSRSGGEIAVYGSFNPALVRGTNYTMTGEVLYFDAEL